MDFCKLKDAVSQQFYKMAEGDLFRTAAEKDGMWITYIDSFPEGSNPIFRERTEHDCTCCKQFIRAVGNAVAIVNGKIETIWDAPISDPAYAVVAKAMSAFVKASPIEDVFLHYEKQAGTEKSFEHKGDASTIRSWPHFYVRIPHGSNRGKNFFCEKANVATKLGDVRATKEVFERGLTELTIDAIETVLDLTTQNSIYRGAEYKDAIKGFLVEKKKFDALTADTNQTLAEKRSIFAWSRYDKVPFPVARIRNTAIGTLLIDLSSGDDLESAVRKFETSIMAPTNYKRPTALVSAKQVEAAKATIATLGLTTALDRRYARLTDININDILFADRDARKFMKGDIFDGLATKKATAKNLDRVETIPVEKFFHDVVPTASSIEVFLENGHEANLVSLIAPLYSDAKQLFKWDNGFSWAYKGDVADSMKERVKKAGGNVVGDLCCRLQWFNHDDLDLHLVEPSGSEIYFGNKHNSMSGGMLDVDMNAGSGTTRTPVENIFYPDQRRMQEGVYRLYVNQFSKRESADVGFEVEIDFRGEVHRFAHAAAVPSKQNVTVASFEYRRATGFRLLKSLSTTAASRSLWGVPTQEFHKVSVLMKSPNHWEGQRGVGNRHFFFMLDGCRNDGEARGFFNEFLRDDLQPHRKVIELVGSKKKTQESENQLSGLGFSDTKRAEVLVRVKGSFNRSLKVAF